MLHPPAFFGDFPGEAQMLYLEARQRFFPCRAMLVAIAWQNSKTFVHVFKGCSHDDRATRCKMGHRRIAQIRLCETEHLGGYRTVLGDC